MQIFEALDPFQTVATQSVDNFSVIPEVFRMEYIVNRYNCDFTNCKEIYYAGERTFVNNQTTKVYGGNNQNARSYYVLVDVDLYSEDTFFGVQFDQCCANMDVQTIPQLLDPYDGKIKPMMESFSNGKILRRILELKSIR